MTVIVCLQTFKVTYSRTDLQQKLISVHVLPGDGQQEINASILLQKHGVVDAAFCLNYFSYVVVHKQCAAPLVASERDYLTPSGGNGRVEICKVVGR